MTFSRRSLPDLQRLSALENIPQTVLPPVHPRLSASDIPELFTDLDKLRASELLKAQKGSPHYRPPSIRTTRRKESHLFKTATLALLQAIPDEEPAGVIQVLLKHTGKVTSVKNQQTREEQTTQRSELLELAVGGQNLDIVWLLAPQAAQEHKDAALQKAIIRRKFDMAAKLLQYGADPNSCQSQLREAALAGNKPVVTTLLRSPTKFYGDTILEALTDAVKGGNLEIALMIADISDISEVQEIDALREAIRSARCDLLLSLLLRAQSLKPSFLDRLIQMAFDLDCPNKPELTDALLYAGGSGGHSRALYARAVENQQTGLVNMFAKHHVDINWGEGRAVILAIKTRCIQSVTQVVQSGCLSHRNASKAIKTLPHGLPPGERLAMLKILLDAGASGPNVDAQLVIAVEDRDQAALVFLRERGASLDSNDGAAIIAAIHNEDVSNLKLLLGGMVEPATLSKAFPHLRHKRACIEMTKSLLDARATGDVVDAALRDAIYDDNSQLVDILIKGGADPAQDNLQSLRQAVFRGDVALFQKLLYCPAGVSNRTVSTIVSPGFGLENPDLRLQMLKLAVGKGCSKESISNALCMELSHPNRSYAIVVLLVTYGNVDLEYNDGKAMLLGWSNEDVLKLLLTVDPISETNIQNAMVQMLQSELSDYEKSSRAAIFLKKSGRQQLAYKGLNAYMDHCRPIPGTLWPLRTFEVLIDAKPSIARDEGHLLLKAVDAAALKLLDLLLKLTPPTTVIDKALIASINLTNEDGICHSLLQAAPSVVAVSSALIIACERNKTSLCQPLSQRADLSQDNYAAIRRATSHPDMDALNIMLAISQARKAPDAFLVAAFEEAIALPDRAHRYAVLQIILQAGLRGPLLDTYLLQVIDHDSDADVIQLLVDNEASPEAHSCRAVVLVAIRQQINLLEILWPAIAARQATATQCFRVCIDQNLIQHNAIDTVEYLLARGAKGTDVDYALILAVDSFVAVPNISMVQVLLRYGADANFAKGESLYRACAFGHSNVVDMLIVESKIQISHRVRALDSIIESDFNIVPTAEFCQISNLLTTKRPWDDRDWCPSLKSFSGAYVAVKNLLIRRPAGPKELAKILEAGCPVADSDILYWAMTRTPKIKSACVELLIEAGADVHYVYEDETMLQVAIQRGRSKLLKPMIRHMVNVSHKNWSGRSALLLAIEVGCPIEELVALAHPNDGSLNQAVRKLLPNVVQTLLDHKHDPSLPSPYSGHGRRTPLAELLYIQADPSKYHQIGEIFGLLTSRGADVTKGFAGKPLLCLALDNSIEMAEAILRVTYQHVDADFNLHRDEQDSDGIAKIYSPIMYARKQCASDPNRELLLKQYHATRLVYFHLTGPQPDDATGMPPDLAAADHALRARAAQEQYEEHLHQETLRRTRETADTQNDIQAQKTQQRLDAQREEELTRQRFLEHSRTSELQHTRATTQLELARLEAVHATEVEHQRAIQSNEQTHQQTLQGAEQYHQRQLQSQEQAHRGALAAQEAAVFKYRDKAQRELEDKKDEVDARRHRRRMQEMTMVEAMPRSLAGLTPSQMLRIEHCSS